MGRPSMENTVFHALLCHIADGRWADGQVIPNSRELASEFGVSLPTLRRALCQARKNSLLMQRVKRPDLVIAGAKEHAKRLLEKPLSDGRIIGILIPATYFPLIYYHLYNNLTQAFIRECRRNNFRAVIIPWPLDRQLDVMSLLKARNCIAAISIGVRMTYFSSLSLLSRRKFPIVLFHRRFSGIDLPTVRHDDFQATKFLADHLVKLGHRNMCLITGRSGSAPSPYGFPVAADGWWEYLEENNLLDDCIMPVHAVPPKRFEPFGRLFNQILSSRQHPTALVFDEQQWATMFLNHPKLSHVKIPEDISIVAIGTKGEIAQNKNRPPVSFLEIDLSQIAERLFATVVRMLNGVKRPPSIRVPLKFNLTDSVGPAFGETPSGNKTI